ncbi:MAG TPA: AI-2E family transporter [Chloroflexota bacterium]|nr:AI-2E family transporter [Chloroflexota bacterium]
MIALPDEVDRASRSYSLIPASWQRALYLPLIILAWLAVAVVAGWLLTHVAKSILVLVLSGIVAYALTPIVAALARWMPRGLAIAVAYVVSFAVLLGLGALLVDTAASQITNLAHNLPKYQLELKRFEPQLVATLKPFGVTAAKIDHTQSQAVAYLQGVGTTAAAQSVGIVSGILSTLIDMILILILSVYLTANGPKIAQRLRRETPLAQRWRTALLIAITNQVVGGYIRGTLAMATLIGVLVGVGMLVLHIPYAILLGVLAFFMEFIPIIGVLVSGTVCVIIALFQGWVLAVIVLAYFVVVHIIEGDIVGPRVMGKAVGIHPATALIGLVAGTELFGLWGALFAAPLAGLLQAVGTAAWRELRGGDPQAVVQAVVTKEKQEVAEKQDVTAAVTGQGTVPS